ncbi:hypothetical protein [Fimbriiglobus ruber]|uniref:Lipoprotein n=1 Tax=Fimbriiglobus ruber TaxID=1908690 RepID=A0A225DVT3_9BACT|nr:hypothetical protein [Fimbriiglobus ruber]OWK45482.1 hypothetical protein FRUB_01813 [Fimbriiglobus ruber]
MRLSRTFYPGVGFALVWALAPLVLVGCGARTTSVSGTVSLDGKPLDQGKITFRGEDRDAQPRTGEIKAGKYQCDAPVGHVRVEVEAFQAIAKGEATGMGQRNYIPEKYNARTELTADVVAGKPQEFNFDLHSEQKK